MSSININSLEESIIFPMSFAVNLHLKNGFVIDHLGY